MRLLASISSAALFAATVAGCSAEPVDAEGDSEEEQALLASSTRPKQRFLDRGDPNRRILVVVSAADTIELIPDENHSGNAYVTGVFARELSEPLKVLAQAGYSFDFATPGGKAPTWDINGLELPWFFWGDAEHSVGDRIIRNALKSSRARDEAVSILMEAFGPLRLSQKDTLTKLELPTAMRMWRGWEESEALRPVQPKTLASVAQSLAGVATGQRSPYVGLFIPGGHAPMTDLAFDPDMAVVLRHFHDAKKPTGVICHGPVALMSVTGKRSYAEWRSMTAEERSAWPYAGYTMTVETTSEEHLMEKAFAGGQKVAYYVDGELERAGAVLAPAKPTSIPGLAKVSADRELVSGQSPSSANCLARVLDESIRLSESKPGSDWWSARAPVTCDGQAGK